LDAPVGATLWSRGSSSSLSGELRRSERQESFGLERGTDHRAEQGPEDENPRSVTGMKQARTESRRVNRRGRAKRRGRKVAGSGKPAVTGSAILHALKGIKAQEGAVRPRGRRRSSGVCPGGAREAMRGVTGFDGCRSRVRRGRPDRRRNGLPGALNQYGRYSSHRTSASPRNPTRVSSGAREGDHAQA